MSAALHHLRVNAWALSPAPLRLVGVPLIAVALIFGGFQAYRAGAGVTEGPSLLVFVATLYSAAFLSLMASPQDRPGLPGPALPLTLRRRVLGESVGGLLLPLSVAVLLPLLAHLAYAPLIAPTVEGWHLLPRVLVGDAAKHGAAIAQLALLGGLVSAPVWMMVRYERALTSRQVGDRVSLAAAVVMGGLVLALGRLGLEAVVLGSVVMVGVTAMLGPELVRLGEAVLSTYLPSGDAVALSARPHEGLADVLGQDLRAGLRNALLGGLVLVGLNIASPLTGLASKAPLMGLVGSVALVMIGALPAWSVSQLHGARAIAEVTAWLPRSQRWFLKRLLVHSGVFLLLAALVALLCSFGAPSDPKTAEMWRQIAPLPLGFGICFTAVTASKVVVGGRGFALGVVGMGAMVASQLASVATVLHVTALPAGVGLVLTTVGAAFGVAGLVSTWAATAEG